MAYLSPRLICVSLMCLLAITPPCQAEPLTLDQAYSLAVTVSKTLKQREQEVRRAEARYQQAMAELFPTISLLGNYRLRNSEDFGSLSSGSFDDPSSGMRRSRSLGESQAEAIVAVSQPIFRGFREFVLADAATAEGLAYSYERQRAEELLLLDTAELFLQLLLYENQEKVIRKIESTLNERIRELREYVALGKARESEVLAAEGDLTAQRRLIELTRRSAQVTRELLASLLEQPADSLSLVAPAIIPHTYELDLLLTQASTRADLKATEAFMRATDSRIEAEKRRYLPSLSFEGNAYAVEDPDRNRDWEILLRFDAPLYEGGRIDARVRELEAERTQYQYEREERQRVAIRDVRAAHAELEGVTREWKQSHELVLARRRNYELQRSDYNLGLVTNLDVLTALTELQNAELDYERSSSDVAIAEVRLKVAAGGFTHDAR